MNIWFGSNENVGLSNLAQRPFFDKEGREYISVEHAYQCWKSGKFDKSTYCKPWKEGKKFRGTLGVKTEGGWNIRLMEKLIRASFLDKRNFEAKSNLIMSHPYTLTHTQDKGIWGKEFPRILMDLREELV